MPGIAAGYERLARTVLMVLVAQVAFVAHTLLGVVVAGLFPSVAATVTTFRTWVLSAERSWTVRQTWTVFHRAWKAELRAANAFGWPQLAVGMLLVWDYYLANWNDMGAIGIAISGILLLAGVLYGVFALVSWVVRAHFDERGWWIVRTSLRMVLARPVCSLMCLAMVALILWAWWTWPGLAVAFGAPLPLFGVVLVAALFGRLPGLDLRRDPGREPVAETAVV